MTSSSRRVAALRWRSTAVFMGLLLIPCFASAQVLGVMNDRTHPELRWMEMETEHFLIIYHPGIEDVARRAALVAEQVIESITALLETPLPGKTSIFLTDEDETVNGFALPGKMFIWVNTNGYVGRSGGTDDWLRQVIAHELQHDVWMEAAQDWTGVVSLAWTPSWFVEGLAEYHTEEWGPGRSDLVLRGQVLRNQHQRLDPHDSGFSKVRYLAETYGDSVIVQAVKKRGFLGLADFAGGFREATGISLDQFDEEWRRAVTAYTYAVFGQKEQVVDVGSWVKPPLPGAVALRFSPDGRRVGVLSRANDGGPLQLHVVERDSTERSRFVDEGPIDRDFSFSPDGERIVYAKLHRSDHGSLLWDLKLAEVSRGEDRWITSGRRATDPHWSPVDDRIAYLGVDGLSTNLYICAPDGGDVQKLTHHPAEVRLHAPRFSPDATHIAYGHFDASSGLDLRVMRLSDGSVRRLTAHRSHDLRAIWSPDGEGLFFTGARDSDQVPNLHRVPLAGGESNVERLSDVGEALFGMDVDPRDSTIVAMALATTDTLRIRAVSPERRVSAVTPSVDPRFTSWRDRVPPRRIPPIDYEREIELSEARPYRAWRHMSSLARIVVPSSEPWGVAGGGLWMDAAHRVSLVLGAEIGTKDDDGFGLRGGYGRLDTNRPPLSLPGFLSLWGSFDGSGSLRLYGDELLRDRRRTVELGWRLPLSSGEHLYANHELELRARWSEVELQDREDIDLQELAGSGLPSPALDYKEHRLGFVYRSTKSRPHRWVYGHARRGHGLLARFDWSDEALGSELEYRRLRLDGSVSDRLPLRIPLLASGVFARARYDAVWGEPAPQDFVGLRADVPLLPAQYRRRFVFDDVLMLEEGYFLRGDARNIVGTRAFLGTLEWRIPLLPALPISAFAFAPGGLTGVLFYDQARVWDGAGEKLARHTVGWELRAPLLFGGATMVVPSYGEGQSLDWEAGDQPFTRDEYFKLAFVQGF